MKIFKEICYVHLFVVDRVLCCFQIENELCCNFSRGVYLLQVASHRRMTHDSELNGC